MENQQVEWRSVPERMSLEHEVSSDGRIRRTVRAVRGAQRRGGAQWQAGKILTPFLSAGGYLTVKLAGRQFAVRRIVCEAFHGSPEPGDLLARHLNDRKHDNRASNLEWGTRRQNWEDSVRNGTVAIVPQRFDRVEARQLRDSGMTWRQVGAALGVSHVAAMNALRVAASKPQKEARVHLNARALPETRSWQHEIAKRKSSEIATPGEAVILWW